MTRKFSRVTRDDFNTLLKKGRVHHSPFFTIRTLLEAEDRSRNKISVVAPKKLLKRAVDRNKIKRRTSHAARHLLSESKKNFILAIHPKAPSLKASYTVYEAELHNLLKKGGLL